MSEENYLKAFHAEQILARENEWSKWREKIPFINFPKEYEIKIIPPSGGAIVRFHIKKGDKIISVYLDCYDKLGCFGMPYWEMYPRGNDIYRTKMEDVAGLLYQIKEEFDNKPLL